MKVLEWTQIVESKSTLSIDGVTLWVYGIMQSVQVPLWHFNISFILLLKSIKLCFGNISQLCNGVSCSQAKAEWHTIWLMTSTITGNVQKLLGSNAWECQLLTWTIYASILRSHSTTYLEILETTFYFLFCLVSCQCTIVQDKTGGKVIYRNINILILYRGRNYDPKQRPQIPLMLWKPLAPIYPRLVQNVADGLTFRKLKNWGIRIKFFTSYEIK